MKGRKLNGMIDSQDVKASWLFLFTHDIQEDLL